MHGKTLTTALCILFLWNHVEMKNNQCQVARNVSIERIQGPSGVVSNRVTVDYGMFTTCVLVDKNGITDSEVQLSGRLSKPPPGPLYELVPSMGYYKMHNEPKTWDQAVEICEREGAQLAVPNNRREALLFIELHNRLPTLVDDWRQLYTHIGIQNKNGEWLSIHDEPFSKLGTKWQGNQPKSKEAGGGDCAMFHTLDGFIRSVDCNMRIPFLCEQEL